MTQLPVLSLHTLSGESENNNLQMIHVWLWVKPSTRLSHLSSHWSGLFSVSVYGPFSKSHSTHLMSSTSTAHSPFRMVPDVQPVSNHSLSASTWSALGRRKHSPHRGCIYFCDLPYWTVLGSRLIEGFRAKEATEEQSHVLQKVPLGVQMARMMGPWRSCLLVTEHPSSPRAAPSQWYLEGKYYLVLDCSQHISHHLSQGLLAATGVRCRWLTRDYGGQKNVDVLAKSILWKPLSSLILQIKRYF